MSITTKLVALASLAALTCMAHTTWADTTGAKCEMYKKGEKQKDESGHCTFSQRQGYVDITLRNGNSYNLSPGNKENHFKDQNDRPVKRTMEGENTQNYKWEHKKIIVTFSNNDTQQHHTQDHHSSGQSGDTPDNLRDLVGQRGGQAEDQLQERGYKLKNSSKSDDSVYSNWKEKSTGRCVTIRTVDGRYKSIVYTPDYDCKK